jgi:serine/threonine protein kinase
MTIPTGSRLGPYEVLAPLGAGGMGEVYRARDTRLERTVAVKVLPPRLSSSEEMRQRFEREAKAVSQLSHPHICALYDVGSHEGTEYLVMELLEGETLAERLAKGPLPVEQTVRFGSQICSALDAAHRRGIVHRDLKPGNVMLTASGVKLLDFGLAKSVSQISLENPTSVPTAAADITREGAILGTVSYMAPEQLEGKETDARADIFALGSVLYEMATGRKAFVGQTAVSVASAILTVEPPAVSATQPMSPPALDRLVKTCLAKSPADRWQSAHDVGLQLAAIAEGASAERPDGVSSRRPRAPWLSWLLGAVAGGVAVAALLRTAGPRRQPGPAIHFAEPPPARWAFAYSVDTTFLAISPDGSQIAYVASQPHGERRIFLRPLSAPEARPIAGTEGARSLFWSRDSRSIGFFAGDKLKRVDASGGAALSLCDVLPGMSFSGTWGRDGDILFASVQGEAIYRVSGAGGGPAVAFRPDPSHGESRLHWPWFLPDGQRFLYLSRGLAGASNLMLAEPGKAPRALMSMQSTVQYVDPGFLVFARDGVLLGQRFDPEGGRVVGEPFSIAGSVRYFLSSASASFSASRAGTLAFQSQGDVMRLTWLDRTGRQVGTLGPPGPYVNVAISSDGRRVLFDRARAGIGTLDIWSIDPERGTETPITSEPDTEAAAVLLPGGQSIAYSANRGRQLQLRRRDLATGKDEELLPDGKFQFAQDVSPDGKSLVYLERGEKGAFDVWTLPLYGGGKPVALLQSPFNKFEVRFSRDGRFVAMISNESGQPEVYVMPYPGPGERVRVSTGGAEHVRWSRDGREIFYLSADRRMTSVPVQTSPSLQLGTPTPLFTLARELGPRGFLSSGFDVSPDGQRFLVVLPEVVADELPLSVVVNWTAEVGR